jgi:hypothetical protein
MQSALRITSVYERIGQGEGGGESYYYGAAMPWKNESVNLSEKKPVQSVGLHSIALERHYSVPELAAMWHITEKTVRRLFEGEPGVLCWGAQETTRKRRYQSLRIPESVVIRVHHRRQTA